MGDPLTSYHVHSWLALLLARVRDRQGAQKAFQRAIRSTNQLLEREPKLFRALDAKGLASSGLAVLTGESRHLASARDAYAQARAVTRAPGVVRRVELLLSQLGQIDRDGILADVKRVALG